MIERIYMDDFHYESYDNYKEALEAWSVQAAQTQIAINADLDYDIGVEMSGLSDVIMFDEKKLEEYIGTEGIKDKVKNMASRVKSNLTLWIKKFVNFFFGWIVNFFKGVVNIRKSLKAGFDKASAYLKKMNEMSGKMGREHKDEEGENKVVKVSNTSPLLIKCLSTVLLSSYLLGKLGPLLNVIKTDVSNADKTEENGNKSIDKAAIENIINKLTAGVTALGGVVSACDPRSTKFYKSLQKHNFSIVEVADDIAGLEEVLKEKYTDSVILGIIIKCIRFIFGMGKENESDLTKEGNENSSRSEDFKKAFDAIKQILTNNAKDMEDIEPEEQPYQKAFTMIKVGLSSFVTIAKANKSLWNFEKVAEGFEKVRRKILPLIDKYNPADDKESNELFNRVASIGNLMSSVSSNANKCMQNVNKFLDTVITDAARLGAAVTSASGNN